MKDNLRQAFIDEATELLEELEYSLLELEKGSNSNESDLIAKVFRALHTFKGSSGMFGYDEIALFMHDIESVYDYIRNGNIKITRDIISLTLSAKDQVAYMLNGKNASFSDNSKTVSAIKIAFKGIIADYNSKNNTTEQNSAKHSAEPIALSKSADNLLTYHIRILPFPDFFLNGTNPVHLLNEFRGFGPSIIIGNTDITPCLDTFDPSKCYSNWDVIISTSEKIDVIKDVFEFIDEDICNLEVNLLDDNNILNNKSAHTMLGQLLSDNHDISKDDIIEIVKNIKSNKSEAYDDKFSDYKMFEKLKEDFRNSGLSGIVNDIRNMTAEICIYLLKLEGDAENNKDGIIISELLRSINDISDYLGLNTIVETVIVLEKLIKIINEKIGVFDSKTIEIFLQGIDYLNKILDSVISNIPIEDVDNIIISVNELITEFSQYKNIDTPKLDNDQDIVDEKYIKEYLTSVNEMLELLEANILNYEISGSTNIINEIFRIIHTIKGDSSIARLNELVSYTNILENLLDKLRKGQIQKSAAIIDILLKATSTIKSAIEGVNKGIYNLLKNQDIQMLKDIIQISGNGDKSLTPEIPMIDMQSEAKTSAFINQISQYNEMIKVSINGYLVDDGKPIILERLLNNLENAAKYVNHDQLLRKVAESKICVKKGEQWDVERSITSLTEYLTSLICEIKTQEKTNKNESKINLLHRIEQEKEMIHSDVKQKSNGEVENRTMRVDEHKIDAFSNMIGELVIVRNSYEYLLKEVYSQNNIEQTVEKKLNDNLHLFNRLTNDLQVGVLALRMVPLKSIFQKYTRVIRDIAKKQNKVIDFVTHGYETEVDKKIADSLSDPLIHLIRNACDHGIETPEERVKLGKPEMGTVLLKASIEGGKLVIVISDDGKGLDRIKIFEKAQKMGFDIKKYDEDSILNLIFEPGFSTKNEVSELSGRGVGMDVVKTTIDKLDGSYSINTEKNVGTEITFVIPMSIGLSDSLLVEAKGETFALPVLNVVKTLKIEPTQFFRMHDRLGFNHRGEVIPTATLLSLLNGASDKLDSEFKSLKEKIFNNDNNEIPVVIMQSKKGIYGIIVDKLMKNIELSIKPVPECLANSNVISGVSILGDGNVVLVLNPDKLV